MSGQGNLLITTMTSLLGLHNSGQINLPIMSVTSHLRLITGVRYKWSLCSLNAFKLLERAKPPHESGLIKLVITSVASQCRPITRIRYQRSRRSLNAFECDYSKESIHAIHARNIPLYAVPWIIYVRQSWENNRKVVSCDWIVRS